VSVADINRSVFLKSALTGFEGDIVIAVVNYPSCKRDVRSVDSVGSISVKIVQVGIVLEVRVVDVDVLQQHLARVNERHCPHLALEELYPFDHRIGETIEGDLVWTARIITDRPVAFVPDLTVTVEGTLAV